MATKRIDYYVAENIDAWLNGPHIKDGYHVNGSIEEVQKRARNIAGHAEASSTIIVENVYDLADYIIDSLDYKKLLKDYSSRMAGEKFIQTIPIPEFCDCYKVRYNARFQLEELRSSKIVLVFVKDNGSFKLLTIYPV